MKRFVNNVLTCLLVLIGATACRFDGGLDSVYSTTHTVEVRPASATTSVNLGFSFTSNKLTESSDWSEAKEWVGAEVVIDAEHQLYVEVECEKGTGYEPYELNSGWTWKTPLEERKYIVWLDGGVVKIRASYEDEDEGRIVKIESTDASHSGVSISPGDGKSELKLGSYVVIIYTEEPASKCE